MTAVARPRGWAVALVVVGGLALVVVVVTTAFAVLGGTRLEPGSPPYRWSSGDAYVNPAFRGETTCRLGDTRTVVVHRPTNRPAVSGLRLTGPAELRCSGPVQVTRGWLTWLYPVGEWGGWVAFPGAVALVVGWVYRRPRAAS